ncbi:MAG: MopE-related protein [Bradymonadia bacterium]
MHTVFRRPLIWATVSLSMALGGCFEAEEQPDAGANAGGSGGTPVGGTPTAGAGGTGGDVGGAPGGMGGDVGGAPGGMGGDVGGAPGGMGGAGGLGGEGGMGGDVGGAPGGMGGAGGDCTPMDEICNNADDDCDGLTDEGIPDLGAACDPGGGFCPGAVGVFVCDEAGGLRCDGGDAPRVRPERCDGEDNDCDGTVDEGTERVCYNGRPGTEGQGTCQAGVQRCVDGAMELGCTGEVVPNLVEQCGDGEDDDCDGQTDEGCDCQVGETQACGSDIGICQLGEQTCVNGLWGLCEGGVTPVVETCNGLDDDCDGTTDEDTAVACYNGPAGTADVGVCRSGEQRCVNGQLSNVCEGELGPEVPAGQDICGGGDQDCDGNTDEDHVPVDTTCGFGACVAQGQRVCLNGFVVDNCEPGDPANQDLCDGIDNDCDGLTDEDHVVVATNCGLGACAAQGSIVCQAGQAIDNCTPGVPAPAEICDVGEEQDDDCDGEVDEDCPWQTADLDALFLSTCATCHTVGSSGGFNINDGAESVVGVASFGGPFPYITAGNPQSSYLYHKLVGTHRDIGGGGNRMPPGRAWTAYQLERFRLWIQQVAQ